MNSALVEVLDLGKDYFDAAGAMTHACENLTFSAFAGEVFGILGTNGAGKTTALRMLSTVLRPTRGNASIAGYSVTEYPEKVRRQIGFLSADTGIYGRLTPQEVVTYFGRLYGLDDRTIALRMEDIVAALQMEDFLSRRCDKLSSGQKQRVNIARTIIHDPPVLIFDEPTSGLDILAAAQIVKFIKESRQRGRCIIFSTHVMREAEKLCDRLVILHRGRVCATGTIHELKQQSGYDDLEDVFLNAVGELQS
jgi:sodium transport system ATP-binding protein